jgi:hypothetical protein
VSFSLFKYGIYFFFKRIDINISVSNNFQIYCELWMMTFFVFFLFSKTTCTKRSTFIIPFLPLIFFFFIPIYFLKYSKLFDSRLIYIYSYESNIYLFITLRGFKWSVKNIHHRLLLFSHSSFNFRTIQTTSVLVIRFVWCQRLSREWITWKHKPVYLYSYDKDRSGNTKMMIVMFKSRWLWT